MSKVFLDIHDDVLFYLLLACRHIYSNYMQLLAKYTIQQEQQAAALAAGTTTDLNYLY